MRKLRKLNSEYENNQDDSAYSNQDFPSDLKRLSVNEENTQDEEKEFVHSPLLPPQLQLSRDLQLI